MGLMVGAMIPIALGRDAQRVESYSARIKLRDVERRLRSNLRYQNRFFLASQRTKTILAPTGRTREPQFRRDEAWRVVGSPLADDFRSRASFLQKEECCFLRGLLNPTGFRALLSLGFSAVKDAFFDLAFSESVFFLRSNVRLKPAALSDERMKKITITDK